MKLSEFKKTIKMIDECDFVLRNTGSYTFGSTSLPDWLQDDMTYSIEKRKANLIEKLKRSGVEVEA